MMRIFNPRYTRYVIDEIREDIKDLKNKNISSIVFDEVDGITPFSYSVESIVMNIMALHNHIERIETNARMNKRLLDLSLKKLSTQDIEIVKQYFIEQEYCMFNEALLYSNRLSSHKVMRHLKRALYRSRTEWREKQQKEKKEERKQSLRNHVKESKRTKHEKKEYIRI